MLTSRVQFILQQSRSARRALLANSPQVFLVGEGGVQSCPTVLGDTMIGGGGGISNNIKPDPTLSTIVFKQNHQ